MSLRLLWLLAVGAEELILQSTKLYRIYVKKAVSSSLTNYNYSIFAFRKEEISFLNLFVSDKGIFDTSCE